MNIPFIEYPLVRQPSFLRESNSNDFNSVVRQQPEEALVVREGQEKGRKPVDPPPIIELKVQHHADPIGQFLSSPFLFMQCSLSVGDDATGASIPPNRALCGLMVSSSHRLKDVDNQDGGFFIFGDLSVRQLGTHRLRFNSFEIDKNSGDVHILKTCESAPFRVVTQREFNGMKESSHLSRAFSDQGVRSRLRKQPRSNQALKRSFPMTMSPEHVSGRPTPPQTTPIPQQQQRSPWQYPQSHSQPDLYPYQSTSAQKRGLEPDDPSYHFEGPLLKRHRSVEDTTQGSSTPQFSYPFQQRPYRTGGYEVGSPYDMGPTAQQQHLVTYDNAQAPNLNMPASMIQSQPTQSMGPPGQTTVAQSHTGPLGAAPSMQNYDLSAGRQPEFPTYAVALPTLHHPQPGLPHRTIPMRSQSSPALHWQQPPPHPEQHMESHMHPHHPHRPTSRSVPDVWSGQQIQTTPQQGMYQVQDPNAGHHGPPGAEHGAMFAVGDPNQGWAVGENPFGTGWHGQ